ncbi:MAG: hypothetical protein KDD63_23620 [Bacteroidetes bacterium]|nr:hypothetical protein [Bacteroidota bacterium]
MSNLNDLFKEYFDELKELTKGIGEPVHLTNNEVKKLLSDTLQDQDSLLKKGKTFLLALNIQDVCLLPFNKDGITTPGLKNALGYEENIDFIYFLKEMIPEAILVEYLKTGISTYKEVLNNLNDIIKVQEHSYTSFFPIKARNGTIYFVAQKCVPVQVDKAKKLISHLNTYTILYQVRSDRKLYVEIGGVELNDSRNEEISNDIIDVYEKYIFDQIKGGIKNIDRVGPRFWRCLYEYLYVYNTVDETKSHDIFYNIVKDEKETPLKGIREFYLEKDESIVRKDMAKVRHWLNEHFHIPDQIKLKSVPDTLRFLTKNKYFKDIKTSYKDEN